MTVSAAFLTNADYSTQPMNFFRGALLSASIAGLAVSVWRMRPDSFASLAFAVLWCSIAWLALGVFSYVSTHKLPILGSLLFLVFSETLFFEITDPLAYAVKPFYQFIAFAAGATIGWVFSKALDAWA